MKWLLLTLCVLVIFVQLSSWSLVTASESEDGKQNKNKNEDLDDYDDLDDMFAPSDPIPSPSDPSSPSDDASKLNPHPHSSPIDPKSSKQDSHDEDKPSAVSLPSTVASKNCSCSEHDVAPLDVQKDYRVSSLSSPFFVCYTLKAYTEEGDWRKCPKLFDALEMIKNVTHIHPSFFNFTLYSYANLTSWQQEHGDTQGSDPAKTVVADCLRIYKGCNESEMTFVGDHRAFHSELVPYLNGGGPAFHFGLGGGVFLFAFFSALLFL